MERLAGRAAVVTGGGSGIGRATALALAGAGVRVAVGDLDAERAAATAGLVAEAGGEALAMRVDVTSEDDLAALRDAAVDRFGAVDVVMSNVGVLALGEPHDIPLEGWQRIVDTNLLSVVRAVRVFLPDLLARGEGHLVHTASTNGLYAYSWDRLPYTATKAAVVALSESLALYTRPRGIGVTVLCPGPVATNIAEQITVYTAGVGVRGPTLAILDPADVGAMVVEAIRSDRFLVLTHPEVHDLLVERAGDPEAFLAARLADLAE